MHTPGTHGMSSFHTWGTCPRPIRGGPQTAVISEKGRFLGFLMTGLAFQGCVFEMQKGRPIVLLIRVLWTCVDCVSQTDICRHVFACLCVLRRPIYAQYSVCTYPSTQWGYLVCNCTHVCTHMCTTTHPHNTPMCCLLHVVLTCIYNSVDLFNQTIQICRSSAHAICQNSS